MNKKNEVISELQEVKDLHDYLLNLHYKELNRKDEIYTSLISQTTIVVALITFFLIIYDHINKIQSYSRTILDIILIPTFFILAYAAFLTVTALFGYQYSYTDKASKIYEYWKKSISSKDIKDYYYKMNEHLIEIIDQNYETNVVRINKRLKAFKMIKMSMILVFLLFYVYILIKIKE
jgi:hypothetical protein